MRRGAAADAGPVFVVGCILFGAHLGWQIERLDIDDPDLCLRLFQSNRDAGLILFAALIGSLVLKEGFGWRRMAGAATVVAGVAALKL